MKKYESDLDIEDLVADFREDYQLTNEMESELRRVAEAVDEALVGYANSDISDKPSRDFTATVFWIGNKFYADADFSDLPVLLQVPSINDAVVELGFLKYGSKCDEKLIDSVNWCYSWTVKRVK